MGESTRILECDGGVERLLMRVFAGDEDTAAILGAAVVDHPPRLRVEVLSIKRVPADVGVSYGHTHMTTRETTLALVAIGYGHGLPRKSGNRTAVTWWDSRDGRTHRLPIVGRVAMDVLVVDASDHPITGGGSVVVFGDPARGEIPITEWASSVNEDVATVLACLNRVQRIGVTR